MPLTQLAWTLAGGFGLWLAIIAAFMAGRYVSVLLQLRAARRRGGKES